MSRERGLLEEQYRTADNLRARIALHEQFSTSDVPYPRWVFDGYDFGDDADVLEVGCGDGMIWRENRERIPEGWRLTLTDLSPAMVDEARALLGDRATYAVADVAALPFPDESFDAVIANHVLFHLADRGPARDELARVLRPGGVLRATTIGPDHLRELRQLAPPTEGIWLETRRRFTIETAAVELDGRFAEVEVEPYDDALEVTDVEPLLAFVASRGDVTIGQLARIEAAALAAIASGGSFHVTKQTARVRARKP